MGLSEPDIEQKNALDLIRVFGVFASAQGFGVGSIERIPCVISDGAAEMSLEQAFQNPNKETGT